VQAYCASPAHALCQLRCDPCLQPSRCRICARHCTRLHRPFTTQCACSRPANQSCPHPTPSSCTTPLPASCTPPLLTAIRSLPVTRPLQLARASKGVK
jgi:hypothetical protein